MNSTPPPSAWLVRRSGGAPTSPAQADSVAQAGAGAGAGGDADAAAGVATGEFASAVDAAALEPSLLPPSGRLQRRFPSETMRRKYLSHLLQRLRRNPRDLQAHVRRILISRLLGDGAATADALHELCHVLGKRGSPLQARLFAQVRDVLPEARRGWFEGWLEAGPAGVDWLQGPEGHPMATGSVPAVTPLVARRLGGAPRTAGPLQLAREALAGGQDDAAQQLLEGALGADPGDAEICAELLSLYARRRLRADLMRTRASLLGRQLALPERWQAVAAELANE